MDAPLSKLQVPLAPFLPHLELEDPAARLVTGAATAADALGLLERGGRISDAVRLVAHALPKREAVWWACMCARAVPGPDVTPQDRTALETAEAWVRQAGDEQARRSAWDAAQRTTFRSPESWAAMAAFWSGGSMAPEGQPVVPPPAHLTGVAVSGAVVLASVRTRPAQAQERMVRFLASARDIAAGGAGRIQIEGA